MAQFYAIINSTNRIPLFSWDTQTFKLTQQLHLAINDLALAHQVLEGMELLSIVDEEDREIARFTEYDGFSSIAYYGYNISPQIGGFSSELVATLTKVNLIEQVQRLDDQINKVVDTDTMNVDEYKAWKIEEFSKLGEQLIFAGTDVTLLNGVVKNFTYNLEDQSNLLNAIFIIQALGDLSISIPYHGHGEPCELYNARDILAVYFTLQFFSTRIQTEVNMKINWVRSCATKEEAEAIEFNSELPPEWAARAEAIMGPALELAAQLQAQYFGDVEPIIGEEEPVEGGEE